MAVPKNSITWFELPVRDIDRAIRFYSQVLGQTLQKAEWGPVKMAIFPISNIDQEGGVHGALVQGESYVPSQHGALIYFDGGEDLSLPLGLVTKAGGTVLQQKMSIGEHGFIAIFLDTEGNRVALHSMR